MPLPTTPAISYSYTGFSAGQGTNIFPGPQLDADLQTLVGAFADFRTFLDGAFRSDGVLLPSALPNGVDLASYTAQSAASAASATASQTASAASAAAAATSAASAATSATSAAASATTASGFATNALAKSANLSDLGSVATARGNLGLGGLAVKSTIVLTDVPNGLFTADAAGRAKFASSFVNSTLLAPGSVVQVVGNVVSAVATGTTLIPVDDTIPQITEGNEYMTQAITPTAATSVLEIEVVFNGTGSTTSGNVTVALFQDSGVNALAAVTQVFTGAGFSQNVVLRHRMVAGTTSATTFRVRAGLAAAGTLTFNGSGGTRLFGGVCASSITVREIKA